MRAPVPSACRFPAATAGRSRSPGGWCGSGSPDRFAGEQDARLPQDLAQRQIIALANIEYRLGVHHAGASGGMGDQAAARGAVPADLFDQLGDSGVGEHVRVFAAARRVDGRIGQHVVQHARRRLPSGRIPKVRCSYPGRRSPAPVRARGPPGNRPLLQ